jgi:hypothetical protein
MNNSNEPANDELAERLWNQQGGHEDHSGRDWLETEYLAHPPITAVQREVDLRMRGLGPLTRSDLPEPSTRSQPSESTTRSAGPLLIAAGVCVGVGVLYSMLRRFSA